MKLLDTSFLIDLLRGNPNVQRVINEKDIFLTTQINMYEVLTGLLYLKSSEEKILVAKEMFDSIRVLPLEDFGVIKAAEICANLTRKGEKIEDCDCLTAGITLSKGINIIVTKNVKHFEKIKGIKVETY